MDDKVSNQASEVNALNFKALYDGIQKGIAEARAVVGDFVPDMAAISAEALEIAGNLGTSVSPSEVESIVSTVAHDQTVNQFNAQKAS